MEKYNISRPISPHLSVHKKLQTSILSITHRVTGVGLSLGSVLIVIWLFLLAISEEYFQIINFFLTTIFGKIFLFFWLFGIIYHLLNGIRYLIWSLGHGLEINNVKISGYIVIILSLSLTLFLWIIAF